MEGLAKPVALWSPGPWSRGLWSRGLWSSGPAVLWYPGPLVPRFSGPVGPLVPWSSGPLVSCCCQKKPCKWYLPRTCKQNESRSHLTPHNTSKTLHRKSKSPSSFMQNPEPSNQIPDGLGADTALPIAIPLLPNITCCTRKRSKSSCPAEEDP